MKVLATFDGSAFSESTLPQLEMLSALPAAEFVLLSVGGIPRGQLQGHVRRPITGVTGAGGGNPIFIKPAQPGYAENKEQAVERAKAELYDYLTSVARRLPAGAPVRIETVLDDDSCAAIVRFAMAEQPDLIVMATHGHTGLVHLLFGDVAEGVVRSGVAPVLLVHPQAIAKPEDGGAS
jgi:nucleotide-binding universal stress UspA family protein